LERAERAVREVVDVGRRHEGEPAPHAGDAAARALEAEPGEPGAIPRTPDARRAQDDRREALAAEAEHDLPGLALRARERVDEGHEQRTILVPALPGLARERRIRARDVDETRDPRALRRAREVLGARDVRPAERVLR